MRTFEQACTDTERASAEAVKAVGQVATIARQLNRAAKLGDAIRIRRLVERLNTTMATARQEVANAHTSWPFTLEEEVEYFRDNYELELLNEASRSGLQIFKVDDRLVSFPSIVRIAASERAVAIDRKRVATVRPSILVQLLKESQGKKPRLSPERFAETLHSVYRLLVTPEDFGKTIALAKVYSCLTSLPGTAIEYGKGDFARDLYFLDTSGIVAAKSGSRFSLPASTGTKSSKDTFQFVTREGETVVYYGLRFS